MADLRRSTLRIAVSLAIVATGLVEVQGLVQTLRSQGRMRDRALRGSREAMASSRARLQAALLAGDPASWAAAMQEAVDTGLASEAEIFETSGARLHAYPSPAPVEHWPSPIEMDVVVRKGELVVGPISQHATRLLTYGLFRSGDRSVVVRLAAPIPDLLEDLEERRQMLLGHALVLAVLVAAAVLILFPGRFEAGSPPPQALDAYEEAMGRLRERGQALSRAHEAELRRMEGLLQDREAMARAGELAAGIAHEVRNGLATILGYARLLELRDAAAEPADAGFRIRQECETLEGVVRRFMDFVKHEALEVSSFDLRRLLSRVISHESRSSPTPQVTVVGTEVTLRGDEELLERAFENLVRNAREAAGPGGRVAVDVRTEEQTAVVTIADDGPGLPAGSGHEVRPFFTSKPGGLGLGLPLALKIVRLHQGDLTLADREPCGLIVQVRLPLAGPRDANTVTNSSDPDPGPSASRTRTHGLND